jgi:hypothetical protein
VNVGAHRSVLRSLARLCAVIAAGRDDASEYLLRRTCTVLALGTVGLCALSTSVAQAEAPKLISYGTFGPTAGGMGVAVDQSNGDVYTAGLIRFSNGELASLGSLYEFDASGTRLLTLGEEAGRSGAAVNPTNGDLYVLNASGSVETYDPTTGKFLPSFEVPPSDNFFGSFTVVQITSDAAGNVYVPVVPENEILEYSPTGTLLKTSRADGASLAVKLTYPTGSLGKDANIKSVKVDLPKQLPSRLTTLQKACTAATFEANPSSCPADSKVGHAKAITPLIPVPLEGPAYFVSHGGAKFPELIVVLQGYGVTLDLHGETFISKAGITSSTFHTVPDAPVGSFELTLPQGPFSALAANGNLCKSTLKMPTAFVGQNGAEIHKSTEINVTGCPKKKAKKAKVKKAGKHSKKRR